MALAHWDLVAQRHGQATTRARDRAGVWRRRLREDVRGLAELFAVVRCFTREFERSAAVLVLVGLAIVAWDLAVPMVGARVIDAMTADRPFQEVALLILGLSALVWIPHGNLLPYLLVAHRRSFDPPGMKRGRMARRRRHRGRPPSWCARARFLVGPGAP